MMMLPRKTTLTSLNLVLLATAANAWDFVIYGDSECEMTPTAHFSESGNKDCTHVPDPHGAFELENMGNCQMDLYATLADCQNSISQQWYD
ncbi:hypothetical protein VTK56DRAFT_5773 [Thermocarpiscus australiensis]